MPPEARTRHQNGTLPSNDCCTCVHSAGMSWTPLCQAGCWSSYLNNALPYWGDSVVPSYAVVDIFAGPGGLAEGFSCVRDDKGEYAFSIDLSIEKEESAHSTLLLRSFVRQFNGSLPEIYYDFINKDSEEPCWSEEFPKEWKGAEEEAWLFELGGRNSAEKLDTRLDEIRNDYDGKVILIGGPPCQAYSLVGRARNQGKEGYIAMEDGRHFLYKEYIRILDRLRPAAFVMENVKGMLSSSIDGGSRIFEQVLEDLRGHNRDAEHYRLFALAPRSRGKSKLDPVEPHARDYVIRAEDFGIPQARHRVIVVGVREDLACDISNHSVVNLINGRRGSATVKDVIGDMPKLRSGLSRSTDGPAEWRSVLIAHSLTSSSDGGDFKRATAQGTQIMPGGKDPFVLVVKKHVSILRNLLAWVLSVRGTADPNVPGGRIIRDVPLLLIDDEADNASANTNEYRDEDGNIDEDADPTKTNGLIRKLLAVFEKSAYVGYTATPFANVFMHHKACAREYGQDLFPRSFIINIPAPSNYIGPEKVFGLERPGTKRESLGLPIVRQVSDTNSCFPPRHEKSLKVSDIPQSLREAIFAFILACSARRARGESEAHNSMLVHVTRFTLVQEQVARLIEEELTDIRRQLEFPGTGGNAEKLLEQLWNSDFVLNMPKVCERLQDHDLPAVDWKQVQRQLLNATRRISVRKINGSAKDALDYAEHPFGLSVIAVGGDKLSRGLTLEGLSVSYFVRTSRMYDTLMQMGRWFGYRPRYADLCRLYTSSELADWYRHIATATAELREEFDLMFTIGENPLNFGHRVRTHPDGMLITAANKMRSGEPVRVGFSGTISETVSFDTFSAEYNLNAFSAFLENLPRVNGKKKYIWKSVEGAKVAELMKTLETSRDSWKANSRAISDYIANRVEVGRLCDWTVVLIAKGDSKVRRRIGPYDVILTRRENRMPNNPKKVTIGRLVSPVDEKIDLDPNQIDQAMKETVAAWKRKPGPKRAQPKSASGPFLRKQRNPEHGLLLIYPIDADLGNNVPIMGFAVSFPFDTDEPLITYAENSVKQLEDLFS